MKALMFVILISLIVSCGGGGSGGSAANTTPTVNNETATTTAKISFTPGLYLNRENLIDQYIYIYETGEFYAYVIDHTKKQLVYRDGLYTVEGETVDIVWSNYVPNYCIHADYKVSFDIGINSITLWLGGPIKYYFYEDQEFDPVNFYVDKGYSIDC